MVQTDPAQTGLTRPVCVVITRPGDVTADRVIIELNRIGTRVIRFDLADFPHHVTLDASFDGRSWSGQLVAHGRTVRLDEIDAVWWWHPTPATVLAGRTPAEATWASREANAGLTWTLASLPCLQVNHPMRTQAAQIKVDVLTRAHDFGLRAPATWIGNAPPGARAFADGQPGGVVCKSIVAPGIDHGDGRHSELYTRPIRPTDLADSIALTAHQLQQRIPKEFEVRLVVVGTQMFPARIDAHSDAARADFRADYGALTYRHIDLPETVHHGIQQLMQHYHLSYAAIDLLVDADTGRWLLIDLNPAGQHDWLQQKLPDMRIASAIAELLSTHAETTPT